MQTVAPHIRNWVQQGRKSMGQKRDIRAMGKITFYLWMVLLLGAVVVIRADQRTRENVAIPMLKSHRSMAELEAVQREMIAREFAKIGGQK